MTSNYLVGIFSLLILIAVSLFVASNVFAQNLTVNSIFIDPTAASEKIPNVTTQLLKGTPEEIASEYYKLGEEFNKKAGLKIGDSVTYIYKNNSKLTIPYKGEYKTLAAEKLLEDVFIPLGGEGDDICWITISEGDKVIYQSHYIC